MLETLIAEQHTEYDLLIRAGRVFCPVKGIDGPGVVAVRGDRIVTAGPDVTGRAWETLEFPDGLLLPGLVDLHAHPGSGDSKYGIHPDVHLLPRGVTTVLSQGDAGAANWERYREEIIEASLTRVLLAINLAAPGESKPHGCCEDLRDVDVDACIRAVEGRRDGIWGVSVNTSVMTCGKTDPDETLSRGLAVAEDTGLPILFGSRRHPDRPLPAQLERLRAGDVVTYCFHEKGELVHDGRVRDEVWAAQARGVIFDVGHGGSSFSFKVAEAALADGFFPDTISSDQYLHHVGSVPQHDLARTLSKFIAIGMPEAEVFSRATVRPAEVLGLTGEVGTLSAGACADLAVLRWNENALPLRDAQGIERPGGCWEPALTVRAGRVVFSEEDGEP